MKGEDIIRVQTEGTLTRHLYNLPSAQVAPKLSSTSTPSKLKKMASELHSYDESSEGVGPSTKFRLSIPRTEEGTATNVRKQI